MALSVNIGGAWKDVASGGKLSVNIGGVWKTVAVGSVNIGGVWKEFFVNLAVALSNVTVSNVSLVPTVIAGFRLDTSGTYSESNSAGVYSPKGTWLAGGSADAVWVSYHVDSGSLNNADPGAEDTRLQLDESRTFAVEQASDPGTHSCVLTLTFFDAASGGNTLDTAQITLSAQVS